MANVVPASSPFFHKSLIGTQHAPVATKLKTTLKTTFTIMLVLVPPWTPSGVKLIVGSNEVIVVCHFGRWNMDSSQSWEKNLVGLAGEFGVDEKLHSSDGGQGLRVALDSCRIA